MGLLDKAEHALDLKIAQLGRELSGRGRHTTDYRGPARTLTTSDLDAFLDAAEHRGVPEPVQRMSARVPRRARAMTTERFLHEVRLMNPLRYRRIRRDMRWLRRMAARAGIDPNEIGNHL